MRTRLARRDCLRTAGALGLASVWPAALHGQTPPRLITIGSGLTEAAYLLGVESMLVGTDTTSSYPEAAQKTPKIGYFRHLSAEGLLALKPDVVVASSEAGPPLVLEQVRGAGVRVDVVQVDHSWDEVRRKIAAVGAASGRASAARDLQARLDADWQATSAQVAAWRGPRPRALFILAHAATPSVAGRGTAADAMIRLIGCDNAMGGYQGYRAMTAEGMAQAAPDVLLATTQGIEAQGGAERFWQRPGMELTPAYRQRRLLARDALEMVGFGPRLPATVLSLHREVMGA